MTPNIKLLIVAIAILTVNSCQSDHSNDHSPTDRISDLPNIKLLLLDSSTTFSTKEMKKGKITVVNYFDPTCHYCKEEIKGIFDSLYAFMNANIAFVTSANPSLVIHEKIFPDKMPSAHFVVGKDINNTYTHYYQGQILPLTAIYDKERKLKAIFRGAEKIEEIIKQVRRIERKSSHD